MRLDRRKPPHRGENNAAQEGGKKEQLRCKLKNFLEMIPFSGGRTQRSNPAPGATLTEGGIWSQIHTGSSGYPLKNLEGCCGSKRAVGQKDGHCSHSDRLQSIP